MRLSTRASLSLLLAITTLLAFPFSSRSEASGYRLLKLDGYQLKWGAQQLGVGATVSYAFARESLSFTAASNCGELASIELLSNEDISIETLAREAAQAFQVWERAAGLKFYEVAHAEHADIIIGAQGQPRGRAFANVSYSEDRQDGVRRIERSLICLNPEHRWKIGFDGDTSVYDLRYTFIHEIGHAIGLDHPGPSGQVMGFRYTEAFKELQPGDLAGARRLYGAALGGAGWANLTDRSSSGNAADQVYVNELLIGEDDGTEVSK